MAKAEEAGHPVDQCVLRGADRDVDTGQAEPAVTQVDTWNAESNNHMIGINEKLNYKIVARLLAYQKTI